MKFTLITINITILALFHLSILTCLDLMASTWIFVRVLKNHYSYSKGK